MTESSKPEDRLTEIELAIASQEATLKLLPLEQRALIKPILDALVSQRDALKAELNARDIHATNVVSGVQVIVNPPEPDPAEAAERLYLRRLRAHLRRMPLVDADENTQNLTLDQLYITLDTQTRVPAAEGQEKASAARAERKERPLSALEAVAHNRRLVLLGDPGSGKTTFVYQLAGQLAALRLKENVEPMPGIPPSLLPVVMTLRDLASRLAGLGFDGSQAQQRQALLDAVWERWRADLPDGAEAFVARLQDALDSGDVLLVFDGLDEVAEAMRTRVRAAVNAVLREYPAVERAIVTCRVRSYTDAIAFAGFAPHTVASFDDDKIRAFVERWYFAQVPERFDAQAAQVKVDDLADAALKPALIEMARNPLLLTTMALIHQRRAVLPRERVRLYAEAVQVLVERWQREKGLTARPGLRAVLEDDRKLRPILERLAFESHQRQSQQHQSQLGDGDLTRLEALTLLERPEFLNDVALASEFLDYVDQRAGLLVGRGGDDSGGRPKTYSFVHRTFQEYLAGCYLVTGRARDRATQYRQRAQAGDYWALAGLLGAEHLLYLRDGASDVLDLAYDLCPEPEPKTPADWRAVVWSGQMAALLGKETVIRDDHAGGGQSFLDRLLARLVDVLRNGVLPAPERAEAGRALGRLGDPRREVIDVDAIEFCAVPAGWFWMGSRVNDELAWDDEEPLHAQEIRQPFGMARFPITQAQFVAYCDDPGGYRSDRWWTEAGLAWRGDRVANEKYGDPFDLSNHPVVGVSWYEAVAFGNWLTARWRRMGKLRPDQVVRLPSEAEWEAAARGDILPSPSRRGSGGEVIVRRYPLDASELGFEELSGKADEWCGSKWEDDCAHHADDNTAEGHDLSVLRCAVICYLWIFSDAYRLLNDPGSRNDRVGFRVVVCPFPSAL